MWRGVWDAMWRWLRKPNGQYMTRTAEPDEPLREPDPREDDEDTALIRLRAEWRALEHARERLSDRAHLQDLRGRQSR